jgi:glutamate dehydrogenase/leucine dehydrogenase
MDPKGLDEDAVVEQRARTGSILGFSGAASIARSADALELDCDVLTDELRIVNSSLEATMVTAYQEGRETLGRQPEMRNLRTAAFVNAINKVARSYLELGVFP